MEEKKRHKLSAANTNGNDTWLGVRLWVPSNWRGEGKAEWACARGQRDTVCRGGRSARVGRPTWAVEAAEANRKWRPRAQEARASVCLCLCVGLIIPLKRPGTPGMAPRCTASEQLSQLTAATAFSGRSAAGQATGHSLQTFYTLQFLWEINEF